MKNLKNSLKELKVKYNFVDILALAVFFSIIAVAGLFFLRKSDYVTITVKATGDERLYVPWIKKETPEWYISNIKSGMSEKDLLGRTNIEVERVYYYDSRSTVETVFIDLKVKSVFNKTKKQHSYNGTPLLVGSLHDLSVSGLKISGIITKIHDDSIKNETKNFLVKGFLYSRYNEFNDKSYPADVAVEGVSNDLVRLLKTGLEVKDSEGRVIAEIIDVKKEASYMRFTNGNNLNKIIDNDRKKVELVVKVSADEINENYYYSGDRQLYINGTIDLEFDDFLVALTLIDISDDF